MKDFGAVILNLFQNPAVNKTESSAWMLKQVQHDNKRKGFTLIELLVVVLIIGILSAVALPQYEIAVMKSKMNSLLPVMRAIKDANEVYYMANGVYVDDLNQLDVSIDGLDTANKVAGRLDFSNNTWIDQYAGSDCPTGNCMVFGGVGIFSQSNTKCYISIYYDHSVRPGEVVCGGGHPKCARVCKSLGF